MRARGLGIDILETSLPTKLCVGRLEQRCRRRGKSVERGGPEARTGGSAGGRRLQGNPYAVAIQPHYGGGHEMHDIRMTLNS